MGRNADRSRLDVLGTVRAKESSDGQSPRKGREGAGELGALELVWFAT